MKIIIDGFENNPELKEKLAQKIYDETGVKTEGIKVLSHDEKLDLIRNILPQVDLFFAERCNALQAENIALVKKNDQYALDVSLKISELTGLSVADVKTLVVTKRKKR